MKIIRASKRHFSDQGWLKTFWLFSFADYYDPANVRHGSLRVFNDDIVEPGEGFPTHSHKEMEIVTIVLSGEITHIDSMDNAHSLKAGEVQRMSAGTGITHSEYNHSSDEPLHFYQIWIEPDTAGLTPTYEQKAFDYDERVNNLLPIVSGEGIEGAINIHSASSIYISKLEAGNGLNYEAAAGRFIFIYVLSGEIELNGEVLSRNDQARLKGPEELAVNAVEESSFVLIDLPGES